MNKKHDLQLFAAPADMTGDSQINVTAREIDFTSSFAKNIQALLDVMSITRMIKKANGTVLKSKTATGTLQSGTVAEGDEIPLSQFSISETEYDSIAIEKYRKGVSLEAIAEHGYEYAIAKTDEEFKSQLRAIILDKFYDYLVTGSLTSTEKSWQMAIAMSIGRVKDKFKTIHKDATGVAVWVNTLDLYEYVGDKEISIQTAFGMDYIKNFMGADIVFISSEIDRNKVIATPLNNLIAYYVDPGDSEFAQAGLAYTTDPETGFIGFHAEGSYKNALSECFAVMGIRLFAEYLDAIAVITVDTSTATVAPTLGELTVTSVAGTAVGDTKITVSPDKTKASNVYKYKVADAADSVAYGDNVRSWSAWDGTSDITAATDKKITVAEADDSYKAIKAGNATVVAKAEPVAG